MRRSVTIALALLVAGCGGSSKGPGETAADMIHALGKGDTEKACSLMSPAVQREAAQEAKTCAGGWKKVLSAASPAEKAKLAKATVKNVTRKGDWADVTFAEQPGSEPTRMHKIGDKWLLDAPPEDQARAQASDAKSMARNAVSQIEACYTDTQDYSKCTPEGMSDPGIKFGSGPGQVEIAKAGRNSYELAARTAHRKGVFRIVKGTDGALKRPCEPAKAPGCVGGTW